MDCIDRSLRLNGRKKKLPFGGVKLILVGDLYQLPPVVMSRERELFQERYKSPYFFSADCINGGLETSGARLEMVELEKIYRQKDDAFIRILNAIRSNTAQDDELKELNQRVGAVLPELKKGRGGFAVTLVPTNAQALEINHMCLERLRGRPLRLKAEIDGDFEQASYPADVDVCIKKGAQVMLLNNDSLGRWVNGSMGEVIKIEQGEYWPVVFVRLENGEEVDVGPNKWDMFRYTWDAETRSIDSEAAGSFVQHPIKLAWAVTIHKSQGKTFDRVVIDMGRGAFAHGQTYVALSRARTLEGIALKTPIKKTHVLTDWRVVKYMVSFQCARSEEEMSFDSKVDMIRKAIKGKNALQIVYLKGNGEKSRRKVWPRSVGEEFYKGVSYPGMSALCDLRQEERMFRVDRILKMDFLAA
jgi:ATP-dependent DNA helicase PIF1